MSFGRVPVLTLNVRPRGRGRRAAPDGGPAVSCGRSGTPVVAALVAAGTDPRARFDGAHPATPLHRAAGGDDARVLDALLAAGADIEAPGAVIGGGTPLTDPRVVGQWRAAHRLVGDGARVTFQDDAAPGLPDGFRGFVEADETPSPDEITSAFWGACHGGTCPPCSTSTAQRRPRPVRPRRLGPARHRPRPGRRRHRAVAARPGRDERLLASLPGGTPHRQ
ncbi:hypothetical protein ACFU3E_22170 [Streptomyces sp. NPDC057424]|uniref:hypothetical protein n=1 Tax=Streptomyces sp. NPDC057424 TaxID=3346127 RepID=UPI00367E63A5